MSENTREIVKDLNDKLFGSDAYEHDYFQYLELVETPIGDYVKYMGCYLWDSENDYRDWIGEEEQEPLKEFLIKEMNKVQRIVASSVATLEGTQNDD